MICSCCLDEMSGTWCGCEREHDIDRDALERLNGADLTATWWSFHCATCGEYISGVGYYVPDESLSEQE